MRMRRGLQGCSCCNMPGRSPGHTLAFKLTSWVFSAKLLQVLQPPTNCGSNAEHVCGDM
jgi:hypothetical protein